MPNNREPERHSDSGSVCMVLITFPLTWWLLRHQLCSSCVLFHTINLVVFTLLKISHPHVLGFNDSSTERLMWCLLFSRLCLHFSFLVFFMFLFSLHICIYLFMYFFPQLFCPVHFRARHSACVSSLFPTFRIFLRLLSFALSLNLPCSAVWHAATDVLPNKFAFP